MKRNAKEYFDGQESMSFDRLASRRHSRRSKSRKYSDEIKNANKTFGKDGDRVSEEEYSKWARNPSRYDIEGVDNKQKKNKMPPHLRKRANIEEMRMRQIELESNDVVNTPDRNVAALRETDSVDISKVDIVEFEEDSSNQKTLDSFQKSVSDSGKQVSGRFDGNYI